MIYAARERFKHPSIYSYSISMFDVHPSHQHVGVGQGFWDWSERGPRLAAVTFFFEIFFAINGQLVARCGDAALHVPKDTTLLHSLKDLGAIRSHFLGHGWREVMGSWGP